MLYKAVVFIAAVYKKKKKPSNVCFKLKLTDKRLYLQQSNSSLNTNKLNHNRNKIGLTKQLATKQDIDNKKIKYTKHTEHFNLYETCQTTLPLPSQSNNLRN